MVYLVAHRDLYRGLYAVSCVKNNLRVNNSACQKYDSQKYIKNRFLLSDKYYYVPVTHRNLYHGLYAVSFAFVI